MSPKLILSVALSGLVSTAMAQTTVAPAISRDENIEKKVEALLKRMTLEEKIGQMTELTIDVITKRDNPTKEFQIDDALLDTVIGKYKVGSILNVPQGIAQSKEKWEEIIKKIQDKSMKTMGIPCIYGVDQIHGTTYTLGGTFFPQGINMAATFNRELVREGARISAYETRAGHILNRMENVGGDLNAYTNKEETVIYSAFLVEHFSRAAELLADIVFHSTFPQHEIDKEVEVIIDEIQSYEDSPSELIFDDFEELIFPNHPLGRNILGKPDLLRSFKSEHALNFTSRFYKATNMIFFIQGNIDFKKVIRTIEKVTTDIPFSITERQRTEPFLYIPKTL